MHRFAAAAAAVAIVLCAASTNASNRPLTDNTLVQYVSAMRAAKQSPVDRILGLYHGAMVIVDERCSGTCPDRTVRIIHYMTGTDCTAVGGDTAKVSVPRGMLMGEETFCIPHVLYTRKIYTDKPYGK